MAVCSGALALFLCALLATAHGQGASIDFFTQSSPAVLVVSSSTAQTSSSVANGDPQAILGGERDILIYASGGLPSNLIYTASVSNGLFSMGTPASGTSDAGYVELKWDGDNDGGQLDPGGLSGINFGGPSSVLSFSYESDTGFEIIFRIYSGSVDDYCTITEQFHLDDEPVTHAFSLSTMDAVGNGCDFTNVGAVTVTLPFGDVSNVDVYLGFIRVDVGAPPCGVTLYRGGDQCTPAQVDECVYCSVGSVQYSFRFQCSSSNGTECACTQWEYFTSDCSGSALQSQLETMPCSDLSGLAPAYDVCFAVAQPSVRYSVNFFQSDPGVVEESCTQLGTNSTCMPCTAGGLTNYYSPTCAAGSTPPCVLQEYSEPTCSTAAVKVAMNELSCGQLHDIYTGQAVCAFSYEKLP